MAEIYRAPQNYPRITKHKKIFLGGSIEMGIAVNWQEKIEKELKDSNVVILNPRRSNWDSTWEQTVDNFNFREQVDWELTALDYCDIIIMYFDPNTKSPISLLELGLYAASKKLIVCCPEGFYRKGNVDIVCNKYNISTVESLEEVISNIKQYL